LLSWEAIVERWLFVELSKHVEAMTLIWLCVAFMFGIVAADWFGVPLVPALIIGGGMTLLGVVWRSTRPAFVFALLAACAFGAARAAIARPVSDASSVWTYTDQRVTLLGTITQQPDWSDDRQVVVVAAEQAVVEDRARAVRGLVRVQLPPVPELRYGQRVRATGVLSRPSSDGTFDFREYLRRQSILVLMVRPALEVVDEGNTLLARLLGWNDRLRATARRVLPEPHAGLVIGMLLGRRNAIADEVENDFRATGTSHLLVISGWNISVLAGTLTGVLHALRFSRRTAAMLTLPVIVLYVLFTGASPAVVRAGIMGALVLWATLADREADAWTSLLLACALMALLDPHVLWNVGFQLSVAGTAGLLAWSSPIEQWIAHRAMSEHSVVVVLARSLAPTLAALLLVTPLAAYQFGTVPLVAPLSNLAVAPAVPPAMLFGMLGMLGGIIALPVGQLIALLAWPFTAWMVAATHLLSTLPWASISVPPFSAIWVWLWYAIVGAFGWWQADRRAQRQSTRSNPERNSSEGNVASAVVNGRSSAVD
jgi:competence protein ComEC